MTATTKKLGRVTSALAGILLIAFVSVGCSALSGQATSATPKVGDCWQGTFAKVQKSENWTGRAAVTCTTKHQFYSYAVAKITKKFSGGLVGKNGTARQDVDDAAYAACYAEQLKVLGTVDPTGRILPNYFLPNPAQWTGGARWVRCDVSELRVGSTIAHPQYADLPSFATLVAALKSNPKQFALCEDDPANNGPDGAFTTYASCTGASDWTLLGHGNLTEAAGSAYPSTTAMQAEAAVACKQFAVSKGHVAFYEPPTQTEWDGGDRQVDCWVNNN